MADDHGHHPAANPWPWITRPATLEPPDDLAALKSAADRLGKILAPALAAYFLEPAARRLGTPLLDPDLITQSRLHNRYRRSIQVRWARAIADAGIDVTYLKGFATAHTLYPDPDVRVVGDLDVLVRGTDFDRLVDFLAGHGFRFKGGRLPPWGFVGRGSFVPYVSESDGCNIDLHVQPDTFPLYRSLDVETVFASAVPATAAGLEVRVPAPEHSLLIAASNAGKDKFGLFALRKIVDVILLLRRASELDFGLIEDRARRAGLLKALRTLLALLARLGVSLDGVPPRLARPPGGLAAHEFARLIHETESLYPVEIGMGARFRREALLCAAPDVVLRKTWLRLSGLWLRRRGLPGERQA